VIAREGFGDADSLGRVFFEPIDGDRTRVNVAVEYEPEGFVERTGDALGMVRRRVEGDLERFKSFIETREVPTGGWRGEIHEGRAAPGSSTGLGATGTEGTPNPYGS
jgi:uncharacterized membrane protein